MFVLVTFLPRNAKIRSADKSSAIQGTVRKVHYSFADGTEMVEEYSTETGVILRRAWKLRSDLLQKDDWEIELGEPMPKTLQKNAMLLSEASTEPFLSKRITRNAIEWRIRNLPYPLCTYTITCDGETRTITVRTSNKKYFKKIVIPEFQRCNFPPTQEDLTVRHQNQTLIISYKKPPILIEMEKAVLVELQNVETIEYDNIKCEDLLKGLIGQ
ncbi:protein DPCD-like isoform X1 [Topomyia yanbarensis]|uniref:protein DPCD-like isoform X1 n=1 Tax=Topomyia yanbarensis TaxID=2498891 RepID=UPI00273CD750|nr:protein DPCD-like isoform X1 [Topomyia yanbarensis]